MYSEEKVGSFIGAKSRPRISHSALVPVIVRSFVFYCLLASPFTDPTCSDWSHKLWSTEQNWLIIHRWPKHTDINTHKLAELCWWGPLCELPVWGCMGCDGGPWTLNAVLLFSADFMPLLSFSHTPNKQQNVLRITFCTFYITFFLLLLIQVYCSLLWLLLLYIIVLLLFTFVLYIILTITLQHYQTRVQSLLDSSIQ